MSDDDEYEHKIKHFHEREDKEDSFLKEIGICEMDKSICLKSNVKSDSLHNMIDLGLKTLKKLDREGK